MLVCTCVCLSICLSICLSVCLSILGCAHMRAHGCAINRTNWIAFLADADMWSLLVLKAIARSILCKKRLLQCSLHWRSIVCNRIVSSSENSKTNLLRIRSNVSMSCLYPNGCVWRRVLNWDAQKGSRVFVCGGSHSWDNHKVRCEREIETCGWRQHRVDELHSMYASMIFDRYILWVHCRSVLR